MAGIETFICKRVFISFPILAAIALAFGHNAMLPLGLSFGSLLSVLRFRSYSMSFRRTAESVQSKKPVRASVRSVAAYMANQLALFPLCYLALKLNAGLFAGLAAGMLIVPATVFVNGITEITGITHNNFE